MCYKRRLYNLIMGVKDFFKADSFRLSKIRHILQNRKEKQKYDRSERIAEKAGDHTELKNSYREKIMNKTISDIDLEERKIGQYNNYSYAITIKKPEEDIDNRVLYGSGKTFSSFYQADPNEALKIVFDHLESFLADLYKSDEEVFNKTKLSDIKLSRLRALGSLNQSVERVERRKDTQIQIKDLPISKDEFNYLKYLKRAIIDGKIKGRK